MKKLSAEPFSRIAQPLIETLVVNYVLATPSSARPPDGYPEGKTDEFGLVN